MASIFAAVNVIIVIISLVLVAEVIILRSQKRFTAGEANGI